MTSMTERERESLFTLVDMAREEDLGTGDLTGGLLPADLQATGKFIAREPLIVCGGALLNSVARAYNERIEMLLWPAEGDPVEADQLIAQWFGPAWAVMAAERVALNFLQRLSGIATLTRRYVDAVEGTGARILDTRKTTPGWRELEKYAVRVGGGMNHRRGLYDAVMVKDNHLAAMARHVDPLADDKAGRMAWLRPRFEEIRAEHGEEEDFFIEIEVDSLDQLAEALQLPVDIVLLDNMPPETIRQAIAVRRDAGLDGKVQFEASGGVTLETVRAIAETGVERISVGALTHSATAVDIGMDVELT